MVDEERKSRYTGRFEKAIAEETKARLLAGEEPKSALKKEELLRNAMKQGGPQGYWNMVLDLSRETENPPEAYTGSYDLAIVHARLGEKENALDSLERALNEHARAMTEIGIEPALDPLRGEARFQDLLQRTGLAK